MGREGPFVDASQWRIEAVGALEQARSPKVFPVRSGEEHV
jgi:hypothetical protein